ncbi:MAG: hypothetical protein M3Z84_06570, partial [Actinomycetota bacterium]|nr:hypothetical protein [Actinomycetota bacterium]
MATTTGRKPAGKARSTAGGSRKPAKARRASAPKPVARPRPRKKSFAATLSSQWQDIAGLVLVMAGVVAGLGIYGNWAGPVGRGLDRGMATGVGTGSVAAPIALIVLGAVLVLRRPRERATALAVGSGVVVVAGAGLLSL